MSPDFVSGFITALVCFICLFAILVVFFPKEFTDKEPKADDPDYVVHRFRLRRDADDLYDMLTEWRTK